jgi:hypothetical protein
MVEWRAWSAAPVLGVGEEKRGEKGKNERVGGKVV